MTDAEHSITSGLNEEAKLVSNLRSLFPSHHAKATISYLGRFWSGGDPKRRIQFGRSGIWTSDFPHTSNVR